MKRDGRRQLKEAHRVGNVHQNWTTGNAHVQQLILLPLSGSFPGALPSPCPGPALPVTAWTAGGHFYPVCSQVSLLFSILFKPVLIHHNIIVLQIAFPVTGKMNEEFLPSQHILTQSHRGQVLPHIALLWLHFFHSKSHLALIFFSFFSTLLSFLFPPPQKAANQKAPSYYKSHLLISCTEKRYNTFLMSHSDNKSCVSSPQSRVWRVQGAVAPQLLLSVLLGYRAWGGLYPNQHKWVSHKRSVFQALLQWICIPPKEICICLVYFFNSLLVGLLI